MFKYLKAMWFSLKLSLYMFYFTLVNSYKIQSGQIKTCDGSYKYSELEDSKAFENSYVELKDPNMKKAVASAMKFQIEWNEKYRNLSWIEKMKFQNLKSDLEKAFLETSPDYKLIDAYNRSKKN